MLSDLIVFIALRPFSALKSAAIPSLVHVSIERASGLQLKKASRRPNSPEEEEKMEATQTKQVLWCASPLHTIVLSSMHSITFEDFFVFLLIWPEGMAVPWFFSSSINVPFLAILKQSDSCSHWFTVLNRRRMNNSLERPWKWPFSVHLHRRAGI